LPLRYNRYGTKAEPAVAPTIDGDRRKCDVADDAIVLRGDKRNGQTSRRAKGLHDPGFVATAMLSSDKRRSNDCGDCFLICSNLSSDRHPSWMPVHQTVGNGWKAGLQPAS
jgi:hypothetical protein